MRGTSGVQVRWLPHPFLSGLELITERGRGATYDGVRVRAAPICMRIDVYDLSTTIEFGERVIVCSRRKRKG